MESSMPLSEYASKLGEHVKQRIGVDPALIEGKLTLRTHQAFRSLQAYNQMVSGFIASVQGHILEFVVLAKVRHYSIV